jgi:UDP-2,3-diacylglucosamine pyrophosphatase LpxH
VYDALVLSDVHLGSTSSQVREIQHFLENLPSTRRLILNGDVLENTEQRLTKQHWRVLSQLRKLSDQLELVWVRGNHDIDADAVAHLIGARFVEDYEFSSGGQKVVCAHGDVWDRFLTDHPYLTNIADWIYLSMQKMSRRFAVRAKRCSKTFLRCLERVRTQALDFCRSRQADLIVCGHTHHAEVANHGDWPAYFNTGCWTDQVCHYWTIEDGAPKLHEVDVAPAFDADPREFLFPDLLKAETPARATSDASAVVSAP